MFKVVELKEVNGSKVIIIILLNFALFEKFTNIIIMVISNSTIIIIPECCQYYVCSNEVR